MFLKVLNAPINLFFDVTPIGKILNRFSKDISTIDCDLALSIGGVFALSYLSLISIIVSVITVPWLLIPLPFIGYIAYKLFTFAINA